MIIDNNFCCGCGACQSVCAANAITLETDFMGFRTIQINLEKCTNCHKCERFCDFRNRAINTSSAKSVYSFIHLSEKVRKKSTSGGAFTAISDLILQKGGSVFGSTFNSKTQIVFHQEARTEAERDQLRGSKYVESDLRDTYLTISNRLTSGEYVLFVGTPCQVGGLSVFLRGQNVEKLVTVDLLCHGTPSPRVFHDHLMMLQENAKEKIAKYNFRDQRYGWNSHIESVEYFSGKKESKIHVQKLKRIFYANLDLRPSCYHCTYANRNRSGDFSIGDFWGGDMLLNTFDNKGISVLFCNTEKAIKFVPILQKENKMRLITENEVNQSAFTAPVKCPDNYELFWNCYSEQGYKIAINKFGELSLNQKRSFYMHKFSSTLHLDSVALYLKSLVKS